MVRAPVRDTPQLCRESRGSPQERRPRPDSAGFAGKRQISRYGTPPARPKAHFGRRPGSSAPPPTAAAEQSGHSRESLYKALSENGNPSLDTVLRVARAVSLRFRASAA
ncbi:MAG: DNA-binding protein [Phycisphaerales bacterium]